MLRLITVGQNVYQLPVIHCSYNAVGNDLCVIPPSCDKRYAVCIYDIRIFCHFLVAKSDQKASLAKAKTHCNRLFENFLHEINSRN